MEPTRTQTKDEEQVLFRENVRLSLPHQKPETASCLLTEHNFILKAREDIKIPLHRILKYDDIVGITSSYSRSAVIAPPIEINLTFFDDLYQKQKLSFKFEDGFTNFCNFKIAIDDQIKAEKSRSMANEEVLAVLSNAKNALCFTSCWVIVSEVFNSGGMAGFLGGTIGVIAEQAVRAHEKKGLTKRSPENILLDGQGNYAIPYTAISRAELVKGMFSLKLKITTGAAKYEFALDKPKDFEKTVSSLSEVLKDKFTWR